VAGHRYTARPSELRGAIARGDRPNSANTVAVFSLTAVRSVDRRCEPPRRGHRVGSTANAVIVGSACWETLVECRATRLPVGNPCHLRDGLPPGRPIRVVHISRHDDSRAPHSAGCLPPDCGWPSNSTATINHIPIYLIEFRPNALFGRMRSGRKAEKVLNEPGASTALSEVHHSRMTVGVSGQVEFRNIFMLFRLA